jgi:hypothetical protein
VCVCVCVCVCVKASGEGQILVKYTKIQYVSQKQPRVLSGWDLVPPQKSNGA